MADEKKTPKFSPKQRLVVGGTVLVAAGVAVFGFGMMGGDETTVSNYAPASGVAPAPSEQSLEKGLPVDRKQVSNSSTISRQVDQQRQRAIQQAEDQGQTFIDNLITETDFKDPGDIEIPNQETPDVKKSETKSKEPEVRRKSWAPDYSNDRRNEANSSDNNQTLEDMLAGIGENQDENIASTISAIKSSMKAPKSSTTRVFTQVETGSNRLANNADVYQNTDSDTNGNASGISGNSNQQDYHFRVSMGTRAYAVHQIGIVSDDQGPALAKIYEGPLKGAKLAGTYQLNELSKGVSINYDRMSFKGETYSIDAIALSLGEQERPLLVDDVDNHYIERYGSIGLAAFVQGYAETLRGTTQVVGDNGNVTTIETPISDERDRFISALGEVGSTWGQELRKNANRPITVYVNDEGGLQVLFLNDVDIRK